MKKQFGHTGDVQFIECELPSGAVKVEKKPVAYGEKSGHLHVITGDYEMMEKDGDVYVAIGSKGAFSQHVHETIWKKAGYDSKEILEKADHNAARLLPGKTYKIGIHKQYDPYEKIRTNVLD